MIPCEISWPTPLVIVLVYRRMCRDAARKSPEISPNRKDKIHAIHCWLSIEKVMAANLAFEHRKIGSILAELFTNFRKTKEAIL